jgi:glycosyltransferase involved in cell wall biosynthesis
VVNAHHEGRLLHPTLRNIATCVREAESQGWTTEVIVVVDSVDQKTLRYLDDHLPGLFPGGVRQLHVRNRDLGLSRNSGLRFSRGRFIAFCDSDNLYSLNWLAQCVRLLDSSADDQVLHPAYTIQFEARDVLWRTISSEDPTFDPRGLIEHNYWDAACVAPRRVFEQVPYLISRAGPGFGPEDWHWNCETLTEGWVHRPAPETAMYYRVKRTGSLLAELVEAGALLAPTKLFAGLLPRSRAARSRTRGAVPRPPVAVPAAPARSLLIRAIRGTGRAALPVLRWISRLHPRLGEFGRAIRPAVTDLLAPPRRGPESAPPPRASDIPPWLAESWREIHEFEPGLFPDAHLMASMSRWDPRPGLFSQIYWDAAEQVLGADQRPPDFLFLIPWVGPGGATAVLENYIAAVSELRPDARIAVLSTHPSQGPVLERRSDDRVVWAALPDSFYGISADLQDRIIATLIVQLGPRVVHLINSPVGYRAYAAFARQLASRSNLFLSVFTLDQTPDGRKSHYVLDSIRSYIDHSTVFVDNAPLAGHLVTLFGLPQSRLVVHHQPLQVAAPVDSAARAATADDTLTVLWAARLDRQKRPDLLIEIVRRARARALPIDFLVAGEPVLGDGSAFIAELSSLGVTYLGPYKATVASLPASDVLLMTSQWEGLPLTLLDAAMNDLTIVAPAVGGVPDFVSDGVTGHLVEPYDDVEAYLEVLARLAADRDLLTSTRSAARALTRSRHDVAAFRERLLRVPGYLD